jgi:hypothetical protein
MVEQEMSEEKKEQSVEIESVRLTMAEFLAQLDTANDWMLWVNPDLGEVELIVKDSDGKMSVFHGPDPMSMPFTEYKAFAAQVDEMTDVKMLKAEPEPKTKEEVIQAITDTEKKINGG